MIDDRAADDDDMRMCVCVCVGAGYGLITTSCGASSAPCPSSSWYCSLSASRFGKFFDFFQITDSSLDFHALFNLLTQLRFGKQKVLD